MNTLVLSLIRTYVPVAVGAFVAWLLALGVELDEKSATGLTVALTGLLIAVYYTLVRLLERQWPAVGVLLGVAKSPDSYSKDAPASGDVLPDEGAPVPGVHDEPIDDGILGRHEAV